jgi:hypothetical protein
MTTVTVDIPRRCRSASYGVTRSSGVEQVREKKPQRMRSWWSAKSTVTTKQSSLPQSSGPFRGRPNYTTIWSVAATGHPRKWRRGRSFQGQPVRRGRECFKTKFRIALSESASPTNGTNLLGEEGWARPPVAARVMRDDRASDPKSASGAWRWRCG